MSLNRPVHFEMHSPDPQTTNRFFSEVFGWRIDKWPGPMEYWIAATGNAKAASPTSNGIDGGIMLSRDGQTRTVNTIQVANVDEAAARIEKAGGKICVPKMAIPGVGYLSYALDPAGVLFGFMHEDAGAK